MGKRPPVLVLLGIVLVRNHMMMTRMIQRHRPDKKKNKIMERQYENCMRKAPFLTGTTKEKVLLDGSDADGDNPTTRTNSVKEKEH